MEGSFHALQQRLRRFRDDRGWGRHHTPANLAQAISVEAAELQRLFLWDRASSDMDRGERERFHNNVTSEVADVMIYCLNLCDVLGVNPIYAMDEKIDANALKYPVGGV